MSRELFPEEEQLVSSDQYQRKDCLCASKTLSTVIQNLGPGDLTIRIVSILSSIEYEEFGETTITAGSTLRYIEKDIAKVVTIYYKSSIPGAPAVFNIDIAA